MKNLTMMRTDAVVIGGGAAGMLAAAMLAEKGLEVVLLDGNRLLGKKLRITGKGRCNVTNNCDAREVMANTPTNSKFLYSALSAFSPEDTMSLFEGLGVPLKTERGSRVFPVSDRAADIADALVRYMKRAGARVSTGKALGLVIEDGKISGVRTDAGIIECRSALVCTGGVSYPGTGSTGDGYKMAREAGHTVVSPKPSLVPLESDDDYCAQMQGFSLRNVTLSVYDGKGKLIFRELGEMLFTHFGVSGPLILSASAHMRDFEHETYRLSIDLKPGLDEKKLDARILRDFDKYANRDFSNALGDLAGRAMIPILIRLSGIPEETKVNSITREQRKGLVELFKNFPVSVAAPRPVDEAIVTSGGVDVKQVNPKTMESRLVGGLYFAGEVLDVDAYTGGFNLQIAWSTAATAANAIW